MIELTGQVIGGFKVVEPTSERYKGAVVWSCSCEHCGSVKSIPAGRLKQAIKRGSTFKCSCIKPCSVCGKDRTKDDYHPRNKEKCLDCYRAVRRAENDARIEQAREYYQRPEVKERRNTRARERYQDDDFREQYLTKKKAAQKVNWRDPKGRKRLLANQARWLRKKLVADPEYLEQYLARGSKEAVQWTEDINARDKVCQICGGSTDLHAHHLNSWQVYIDQRFDLDNGILICQSCHMGEEGYHSAYPGTATKSNMIKWFIDNGWVLPEVLKSESNS